MKQTFKIGLLTTAIAAGLVGCGALQLGGNTQNAVEKLTSQLNITYEIKTNLGAQDGLQCQNMGAEWASCNKVVMNLLNTGETITNKDWKIFVHSIRVILAIENSAFKIEHITGDLYAITPTERFRGFPKGETVKIPMVSEFWQLFETDFMPRAYIVSDDAPPTVIKSMDTEDVDSFVGEINGNKWKRIPEDKNTLATAASRYEKNSDVLKMSEKALSSAIIPTPLKIRDMKMDFKLSSGFAIKNNGLSKEKLAAFLSRAESLQIDMNGKVKLNIDVIPDDFKGKQKTPGAYKLLINLGGIQVTGFDDEGAYYGLQSLLSLMKRGGNNTLPVIAIEDSPRYQYRGVMVDVARNFHTKEALFRTLDQMAAYKLNKLHLHLTDDEGWRLEIPGLPELTDIGGKRCHDLSETRCLLPQLGSGPNSDNFGSGFFSKADYIEIVRYAKDRAIEVIPEIDMPAHSRAAVVSMEARYSQFMKSGDIEKAEEFRLMDPNDTSNVTTVQLYDKRSFINPCMDSSLRFVNKVMEEVHAMHEEAGAPLTTWHFGGDEAKNIKLNAGFQDNNAEDRVAWRGNIDISHEDKPFQKSPMCKKLLDAGVVKDVAELPSYFAEKVSGEVKKRGIKNFQAWQDGLKSSKDAMAFKTEKVRVNFWDVLYGGGSGSAYEWENKGYNIVVSNPDYLYMDMPYEVDPKERGYYWATRATDTRKMFAFAPDNLPQNAETSVDRDGNGFVGKGELKSEAFEGLSAQLWSESVRTDEQYEYMVFPRVMAAAERAWHKADWEETYSPNKTYSQVSNFVDKKELLSDWTRFANLLGQRELAKLDAQGVQYRIPVPGAMIDKGLLHMNISLPGLPMLYSLDEGHSWNLYVKPVPVTQLRKIKIRALSADKQRKGREVFL